jgi:putative transposase
MPTGEGAHRETGRQTPAAGAHIFLGQPNIFFVTVNAKDADDWMDDVTVQDSLAQIWTKEAKAWLVGYYLIMPDHVHFFCAPHDLHFEHRRMGGILETAVQPPASGPAVVVAAQIVSSPDA